MKKPLKDYTDRELAEKTAQFSQITAENTGTIKAILVASIVVSIILGLLSLMGCGHSYQIGDPLHSEDIRDKAIVYHVAVLKDIGDFDTMSMDIVNRKKLRNELSEARVKIYSVEAFEINEDQFYKRSSNQIGTLKSTPIEVWNSPTSNHKSQFGEIDIDQDLHLKPIKITLGAELEKNYKLLPGRYLDLAWATPEPSAKYR